MTWLYDCPSGCLWESSYVDRFGQPPNGVACPRHRLFCGRRGRARGKPSKWTELLA